MPQVIIRSRNGGGSSRNSEQVVTNQDTLVIITPDQTEIYTDKEAVQKIQELAGQQ